MQRRRAGRLSILFDLIPIISLLSCPTASSADGATTSSRPLIAVVGENDGTEVTDFVIPYGVLTASATADVVDVSVHPGPLHLMPGLTILTKETLASFDAKHPEGADYVFVPAMHKASDPTLIAWLQKQAANKATTVGVCDGVWVLGNAGLLADRNATGHWYSRSGLAKAFPSTRWVQDRRYVDDGRLITTTGVTASLPASLSVVERIAGPERAAALAREIGALGWGAEHRSADFQLTLRDVTTAALNWLSFWDWQRVGVPIAAGVDEMSLSFVVDTIGRTYRSTPLTLGTGPTIESKRGLTIVPDLPQHSTNISRVAPLPAATTPPVEALDRSLANVAAIYGNNTAHFVALQLEYPWPARAVLVAPQP